jgi:hypothetical protein
MLIRFPRAEIAGTLASREHHLIGDRADMILGLCVALTEPETAEVRSFDMRNVIARTADARLVFRSGVGGREGDSCNHECGDEAHGFSGRT